MNNKKSRSSLKKGPTQADEEPDPVRTIKRRISFSGKKFIREFDTTEKPRDYDNSYEISDHTNGDDSSGQTHGTVAASVLQSTAHISTLANEMDKENTSPIATTIGSVYEQNSRLSDFTLKLQTSINVTLLPDEMAKQHRRVESPAPLESMSRDSLSLYEAERVKLHENSVYRLPVFEKTMDLVPEKLAFAELEPKHLETRDEKKTIVIPADISCVTQQVSQKTVLFENKDISCDFTDIEPKESCWAAGATAKPTQENESIDVVENDYMNYLPDDSTLSSPLIPLDVISENGISKKLNFRQLNDALDSGQIQLFPNGPKTPTTDRKAKQRRFWHGLEQQPAEQDASLREVLKPRGTLNFNESMMMSPIPQRPEPNLMATADHFEQSVKAKSSQNPRRNYRFSQADELMLDNTNFLVHAKIGDETQSRNSSKSSSRRETTYNNTAMELDDLEKCEAAMRAALESAKHKETMQRLEPMEEETLLSPCKNAINTIHKPGAVQQGNQADLNPHKAQPTQHRSKLRQSLHMSEPIEETSFGSHNELKSVPPAASTISQRMRHGQTLHMAEPIVDDLVTPHIESAAHQMKSNTRRQTIHSAEAMDEDIVMPSQELPSNSLAPTVEKQCSRRRQTLHMFDSVEEDSFGSYKGSKTTAGSMKSKHNKYRQTLLMAEPIQEDVMGPQKETMQQPLEQQISGRRQSLNLDETIREDSFYSATTASVEQHDKKKRHTMHMAESIEEDFVRPQQDLHAQPAAPTMEEQYIRRRQTLHLVESIEEIVVQPQLKFTAVEQQNSRRRQTLLLADPIEEDLFCSMPNDADQHKDKFPGDKPINDELTRQSETPAVGLQSNRRRQTLHMADAIEEDSFCSMSTAINSHRHTLQKDAPIAKDVPKPQEELRRQSEAPAVGLQSNRHRQTLHMADPIEEDSFCAMSAETNSPRHTLQRDAPIAKDVPKPQEELRRQSEAPAVGLQSNRHRQTLHMADPIEEDSFCAMSAETNSPRHTLQRDAPIAKDVPKPKEELRRQSEAPAVGLQSNRRRETMHMADPIEEDSFCSMSTATNSHRHTLQKDAPIAKDVPKPQEELRRQSDATAVGLQSHRRRETMHMADPIEEDSFCSMSTAINSHRRTLQKDEPIAEKTLKPREEYRRQSETPAVSLQFNRRRQTLHMADPIQEDSFCSKLTPVPVEAQSSKNGKSLPVTEAIDIDEIKSHAQLPATSAAHPAERPSTKHRQTLLMSESIQEDITSAHKVTNAKSKTRQALNIVEPIEEAICNAAKSLKLQADPSIDQYKKNAGRTYFKEEAMEEDISCNLSKPTTPPKLQLTRKPRHTLYREEAMDVEMPKVPPPEQRVSKSRPTLLLSDSLELELLSQSATEDINKAREDSPSDSAEWLAQRLKAREALTKSMPVKQEFPSPDQIEKGPQYQAVDSKSVLNRFINRTSVETPEMNKKQKNWHQNFFPITPGRSMIEYEDLEEECKVESPTAKPAVQSIYNNMDMELDMDTSNFGTPKQTPSFTVKRLPIHLTPNLPQPKKRNTHLPVKMEDENVSAIELEVSAQKLEQSTPARNRSRIPVLSKSLNSPWRETEQLDGTVQMVRAVMMGQTRCQKMEITHLTEDKAKTQPDMYEDNPITISDVSNHFTAQRELAKRCHANKAEQQAKESSIESRGSNEHCNKSYATTHKRFINLSGDTVILAAAEVLDDESEVYEIDKTRLSLVSTLLDEEDDREKETAHSNNIESESNAESDACLEQLNPPAVAGAADACKKCKHCRRSMDNATARNISADSFELPDSPDLEEQFERLDRLRQRPRLEDVHKYWELKKLELNPDDEDEEKTHNPISDTSSLSLSQMLEMFNNKCEEYKQCCPKPKPVERFVKCLEDSLHAQLPNWIFHDNLKYYRKYIFSHRKITTFQIVIDYEPLDLLESKIRVSSIKMRKSNIPPKFPLWNVYDHLMDFQLKLNLPLNLDRLFDGNEVEDFVKFLHHIDGVCSRVYSICKNMKMVLTTAGARLIRESNRIILRKTVRRLIKKEDEAFARMEKINFKIEIGNVQEISFKDILQPTLYQFDEKIQFLPKGIAFLDAFLQNPDQFLRRNVEHNN
ncbi:uncharacterized protein [Drosophila virilis]|uniref:Uncharacterized protein, isoform B n=1 Tax=Drosophila virilis TaxID=7244 RepID=A0A0Q9WXH6_DROVI|nr:uncharacterized protein LOC6622547 isoform X2 [Drosophila virilis]XP_032290031.1 uncharacterized protein LOC116650469 isoform X2 [Drosophila virilis]KRF85104.1 uncharacterized protein Dvir_GJ13968, isoform B [Drosophila virilis]